MRQNTKTNPILIIGAGLSGLTTGRLLTNHGIPNIIFEASTTGRSQGFSISLRDWGYEALLESLGGIPLRSLTRGVAPDRQIGGSGYVDLIMRDNGTGEQLIAPDLATQPSIVRANRNALRTWIADCGDEELDVRYGHRLKTVQGKAGYVTAVFENGAQYSGNLVIAADGVHSIVRSKLLPQIVPEVIPAVVYHGEFQLPREDFDRLIKPLSGDSNILAGVGDNFNTPITVCNLTKTEAHLDWSYSRPARKADDPLYRPDITAEEAKQIPQALLDELASRKLAQPWSQFLNGEAMQNHSVFNWTSRSVSITRKDADMSAEKGVVFVGDAWHAMPIFGGEGGCHALVDAIELTTALVQHQDDFDQAIATYYDGAWQRCRDAVKRSKGRFHALHRPIAEWREIALKKSLSRNDQH